MAQVPTGTLFFIASAYAASKTVTAVTNATEAVVTSAAHGFTAGDAVEITSGWGRINRRVYEIGAVTTDSFKLVGQDTTNTTFFPAGLGIGSVRKITAFQQITSITSASSSGGDAKPVEFKFLESDVAYTINDGFSATIECVFKYRTKREFGEMVDELFNQGKTNQEEVPAGEDAPKFSVAEALARVVDANAKYLLQLLEGWNLDVDLSEEALEQLSDELPGAAAAIMETYRAACTEGRLGN